jgi:IclR family acetate operon transcriptional repressor
MKKAALDTPSIQSLDRGLCILEAVANSSDPVPLGRLTDLLGIDRSSVFRLANTLRRRGFLANPIGGRDYILGPSMWRLSRKYGWSSMLSILSHEQVKSLAVATGETAHLAVRHGRQALFIDHHAAANQIIVVSGQTGETVPLYCTAHGKALLAGHGVNELKAVFGDSRLQAHTPRTIVALERLANACETIAAQGLAFDDAEYIPELRCLAAPIYDKDGAVVASIGISAPLTRFPPDRYSVLAQHVRNAAQDITATLSAQLESTQQTQ